MFLFQPDSPFQRHNPIYCTTTATAKEMCDVSQSSSSGIASVMNEEAMVTYFGPEDCGVINCMEQGKLFFN